MENKKVTIIAYNSIGVLYEIQTTIIEWMEGNSTGLIIHKSEGMKRKSIILYDKDSELKVLEGWVSTGINDLDTPVTYSNDNKVKGKLLYPDKYIIHGCRG